MFETDCIIAAAPSPRTDRHRLAGIVYVDGLPANRRVIVQLRESLLLVADTDSNPQTGAWEIYGLPEYPERSLVVTALDHTGNYNAEVADFVSQVTGA